MNNNFVVNLNGTTIYTAVTADQQQAIDNLFPGAPTVYVAQPQYTATVTVEANSDLTPGTTAQRSSTNSWQEALANALAAVGMT